MTEDEGEEPALKIQSKRVFINHVDTYVGRNISKVISQCAVGATLEEPDEEEEDEDAPEPFDKVDPTKKEGMYRVIGTLKDPTAEPPSYLAECVQVEKRDDLLAKFMECDIVIYNITDDKEIIDEAVWAVSTLNAEVANFDSAKMFILISPALTWSNSKPLDPEDPEIPFTEDDYRRRKPHSNFKEHSSAEKIVTKFGKTNKARLQTYVIASGVTYGMGENCFHYFFKQAWLGTLPALPCFGTGKNVIPTIHITDLARVIQNVMDSKPATRYLIATDDSQVTLKEIVKTISKRLGTGKVEKMNAEDALLIKQLKQHEFDSLLMNVRMDAMFVKESMTIPWVAETGMLDAIATVSKEFKEVRKLLPMRICILGPPASGKSTIAKLLCEKFKLHHINVKQVVDDTIARLEASAAKLEAGAAGEENDAEEAEEQEEADDEEEGGGLEQDVELLEQVNENKKENGGRLDDTILIRFFREHLKTMRCQNQGYVLDGFPKTYDQAKELFAANAEEEEDESGNSQFDKSIMPELIISLQASNEFLKDRVMNLPEEVVQGTHNTEEEFMRRLQDFRNLNVEDETVLNYFDELEIHPETIAISESDDKEHERIINRISRMVGEPRNYGPTEEEREELERKQVEEKMRKEAEERDQKQLQEAKELAQLRERQQQWAERLEEVKRQERELLEEQSLPLRNFLMKHVMPTLTKGLIEVCKVRPEDPVDYLAEFLFQNNPDVE